MKSRPLDKILAIVALLLTPLFFISLSALIPCTVRVFYYASIDPLDIPESSGYSREVIIGAYDDVMDFIWRGAEFKTGELAWTESEKEHFEDSMFLFHLQAVFASVAGALLVAYFLLIKFGVLRPWRPKGLSPIAWGGMLTLALLIALGIFALVDFDQLFVVFHQVFFPGKSNWTFNPYTEEVINILPETFFAVCAGFIAGLAILLSICSIVVGFVCKRQRDKHATA